MLIGKYRVMRKQPKTKVKKELTHQEWHDITEITGKSIAGTWICWPEGFTLPDLILLGRNL
jgi:uncharacterized cupin superfamily protein